MLEIVQQHDAFAMLLQFVHHRLPDLFGLAHLEVEGVHVGREDADVALAEILDQLRRLPQHREAEIGRRWPPTAQCTALMPISISSLGSYSTVWTFPLTLHLPLVFDRSW